MFDELKKCECGFGDGWFCDGLSGHEFNRGSNPTAKLHVDRKPEAVVYCHISGSCVFARIEKTNTSKKFLYKKYESEEATFQAAIDWVNSFYLKNSSDRKQLSLFE